MFSQPSASAMPLLSSPVAPVPNGAQLTIAYLAMGVHRYLVSKQASSLNRNAEPDFVQAIIQYADAIEEGVCSHGLQAYENVRLDVADSFGFWAAEVLDSTARITPVVAEAYINAYATAVRSQFVRH